MTDSSAANNRPSERQWTSKYAPLAPDGPLPPSVSDDVVASAYRSRDMKPKRVLFSLGVSRFTGTPTHRLRLAMDKSTARMKRETGGDNRRPAFHDALYEYLAKVDFAKDVCARLIKPALLWKDGLSFLDPDKFTELLDTEFGGRRGSVERVEPSSDMEALALFVLAFGLLQPADAPRLISATISLGLGFREFFKIVDDPASHATSAPQEAIVVHEADQHSNKGHDDALATASPTCAPTATPAFQALAGRRATLLEAARRKCEQARQKRAELGSAGEFNRVMFNDAITQEEAAARELADGTAQIEAEVDKFTSCINRSLAVEGIQVYLPQLPSIDHKARWLDEESEHLEEAANLLGALTLCANMNETLPPSEFSVEGEEGVGDEFLK